MFVPSLCQHCALFHVSCKGISEEQLFLLDCQHLHLRCHKKVEPSSCFTYTSKTWCLPLEELMGYTERSCLNAWAALNISNYDICCWLNNDLQRSVWIYLRSDGVPDLWLFTVDSNKWRALSINLSVIQLNYIKIK